ncbi:MAG TPA: S8 family serine peptidase [Pyrinomonadaceae bacterium]|nr:S8 family serine peptidase [Pyrinomonadaceae bacterium]
MKNRRPSDAVSRALPAVLLAALCAAAASGGAARAQLIRLPAVETALGAEAVSAGKLSPDLASAASDPRERGRRVRVVLQLDAEPGVALAATLRRADVREAARFERLGARVLELPLRVVEGLASHREVRFVSPDRETVSFGHLSRTTGADEVRASTGTLVGGLDGTGIGIAVLDSGIDTSHAAFLDRDNGVRVVYGRDFTGEGRVDDPHGHGTHVASIAAGNGRISRAEYIGIAPNAKLVNLRVLNSQGLGRVSSVLAALDWVLAYRSAYNIRVANLSLGTPAVDSYKDDPVCRAVRRLADAGVVVVAAAGNNGRDESGNKVYGYIHAPGNEPAAVTVGASNTFGTDARSDDAVTTFSSRGPTRSGPVDLLGVKRHDNLVKPDLVAPGNKIIDAAAAGNYLLATNPSLDAGVSGADSRRMMYLNGTSMATPAVAGAAALMLQANPRLTPNLVKVILMYTAQPLAGFNMLEQGAGQLNIEGAVRVARLVRTDLSALTPLGAPLLVSPAPPAPETTIAGESFVWSQGIILGHGYATGLELITAYQKIFNLGVIVTDGAINADGVIVTDRTMVSLGVIVTDRTMRSAGGVMGTGTVFLGSGVIVTDNINFYLSDGVIVTDGSVTPDSAAQALSATMGGEATASMPRQADTGVDCLDY